MNLTHYRETMTCSGLSPSPSSIGLRLTRRKIQKGNIYTFFYLLQKCFDICSFALLLLSIRFLELESELERLKHQVSETEAKYSVIEQERNQACKRSHELEQQLVYTPIN